MAKFIDTFNKETEEVKNLTTDQLIERLRQLTDIAVEARARLEAIKEEIDSRMPKKYDPLDEFRKDVK